MAEYTTILWDMDGVLMDSEPQHYRAWERTLRELFGVQSIDWELYKPCIGCKYEVVARIYEDAYGIDIRPKEVHDLYFRYKAEVEAEEGYLLIPGIREVLQELKKRGYRMAVASSSPLSDIERFVGKSGLSDCFDLLFTGEQVRHSKPAPDTFLEAAKGLQAEPTECLVIEDSYNGVLAAKAAGMYCVGFVNPGSGDQDLSEAGIRISDMRALLDIL